MSVTAEHASTNRALLPIAKSTSCKGQNTARGAHSSLDMSNAVSYEYTFHEQVGDGIPIPNYAVACRSEEHGAYELHRRGGQCMTIEVCYFDGRDNERTDLGKFDALANAHVVIEGHHAKRVSGDANSRRERYAMKLEAKRDRLRARAGRARVESGARHAAARRTLDVIPFGQPVLVGHHSEQRHRRDLARVDVNLGKAVEAAEKAAELDRRADVVGTAGISSDDPDALTKLRVQLAARQGDRELERKWNGELRKRAKKLQARRLAENTAGRPGDMRALTHADHLALVTEMARDGAPAWIVKRMSAMARAFGWLPQFGNNTAADIRRIEERIRLLDTRDKSPERRCEGVLSSGLDDGITFVIEENKAENRLQIVFSRQPSREITRRLGGKGGAGFRFARSISAWQRHLSNGAWHAACCALGLDSIAAGRPVHATAPSADAEVDSELYACPDGAGCRDEECTAENARRATVAASAPAPAETVRYPVKLVTISGTRTFDAGQVAVDAIAALGFEYIGPNASRAQRDELQGAPRFRGLIGPMWDGGLRYECSKTNEELSR